MSLDGISRRGCDYMDRNNYECTTLARIRNGTARIGIIGLGYVGLPLALAFSEKYAVLGYDVDPKKRRLLKQGKSYIDDVPDSALKQSVNGRLRIIDKDDRLKECDAIVICVPTPLDTHGNPNLTFVEHSAKIVRKVVGRGMLIVLESTSYPGTTDEFIGGAIRAAGFRPGKDVAMAFSPERVDPGNKTFNIHNTPKVVGGEDAGSTELAAALYSSIVEAGVVIMPDCKSAEAVKILENIFRGVNIALINEMALIFEKMGIDTWQVVKAASTKPFGFIPHYPGPGVGGHCIPLDPLYMSYKAKQYGIFPRFIELSHEINEHMKNHTVDLTMASLKKAGVRAGTSTVAVMGLAYKKDISDTRESPAAGIIEELSKKVRKVIVHDSWVKCIETRIGSFRSVPIKAALDKADCLVFVTDHTDFAKLSVSCLRGRRVRAIVDTRNLFSREEIESAGLVYTGLGK